MMDLLSMIPHVAMDKKLESKQAWEGAS